MEASTIAAAAALGIGLGGLAAGGFYHGAAGAALVIGYGATLESTFTRGAQALSAVFTDAR